MLDLATAVKELVENSIDAGEGATTLVPRPARIRPASACAAASCQLPAQRHAQLLAVSYQYDGMASCQLLAASATARQASGSVRSADHPALRTAGAGAKKVDVRLAEYGADRIEVADNGAGIAPANYESLALRHHTSKLSSFEDLESMETFGFRGEALSALASLGVLTVTTRQADQDVATTLEFGRGGELLKRAPAAREVGTTVTVAKIFSPLPVRHQEFKRNIKKEFSRLHDVLAGYSLVARNVRLTVTNVAKKGGRQSVIKTLGNGSLRDTVSSVFGIRQLNTLQELRAHSEETGITLDGFVSKLGSGRSSGDRQLFSINSRPVDMSKLSRTCNEVWRQFTSHQYPVAIINIEMSRKHCDINVNPDKRQILLHTETELRELLRDALTEAYAPPALSQSQSPEGSSATPSAASWLVPLATAPSDGAVSDKEEPSSSQTTKAAAGGGASTEANECDTATAMRGGAAEETQQELLAHTDAPLGAVGTPAVIDKGCDSREDMVAASANTGTCISQTRGDDGGARTEEATEQQQQRQDEDEDEDEDEQSGQDADNRKTRRQTAAETAGNTDHNSRSTLMPSPLRAGDGGSVASDFRPLPTPSAAMTSPLAAAKDSSSPGQPARIDSIDSLAAFSSAPSQQWVGTRAAKAPAGRHGRIAAPAPASGSRRGQKRAAAGAAQAGITTFFHQQYSHSGDRSEAAGNDDEDESQAAAELASGRSEGTGTAESRQSTKRARTSASEAELEGGEALMADETNRDAEAQQLGPADVLVDLDLAQVLGAAAQSVPADQATGEAQQQSVSKFLHANLAQEIRARRSSAAAADDKATHELARSLAKEDFEQMQVLGQFNRGFIIAKLRDDLFIIDQHACDEKHNFETMQANTKLHTQRMVNSMPLEVCHHFCAHESGLSFVSELALCPPGECSR